MSVDGFGMDWSGGDDLMAQLSQLSTTSNAILVKNIEALRHKNPQAARMIEASQPNAGMVFYTTDEGIEGADLHGVALASRRRPMSEAKRFAQKLDPKEAACCAVIGFGLGYHCGTLLEQLGRVGVVMCYEPDVSMLRSVLERIDYSELFKSGRFFLFTQPDESSAISQAFTGIEAVIGMGVEMINHPPSIGRLSETSGIFGQSFREVLKATRTHVMTTLANSRVSFRNALMNLDVYTQSAGIESLKETQVGKPAIVVSAGPSLAKNIELLKDPVVQDSMVIIAVQTVLRQLLDHGIRPHFVAALDYHEISKRFYEGLSAEDVEGVRLIAEAKANPAIFEAYPGEVLCVSDELLDELLGDGLTKPMGSLAHGGTVAHLCYYFARYLGCDPVIFIGQDLGFSDGQYYSAGAAIHQVWSGELNPHNTLEMMEWQRIIRMKGLIHKKVDVHGRSIYLDEQMSAYLAQFESDFEQDVQRGLRVIDATEGGVHKAHTQLMTLEMAIEQFGKQGTLTLPETKHLRDDEQHKRSVERRVEQIIKDGKAIAAYSDETIRLLEQISKCQSDQKRTNKLIERVQGIRDRVMKLEVAYRMTEAVNQIGVLNRMKRDRGIDLEVAENTIERQRLQIQRDITNVTWTRDAARAMSAQLESALGALRGELAKETSDRPEDQDGQEHAELESTKRSADCVHGLVLVDPAFGGLGTARDLGEVIVDGKNALDLTIARLDECQQLDAITIVTPKPEEIERMVGSLTARMAIGLPIQVVGADCQRFRDHARRVGSARMQSSACWRGSIGMLCAYDEQFEMSIVAQVMNEHSIDGCAIVGGDWAMVDPELVDRTVERFRIQDAEKRIAFSQAVPGIGTMVVDRATVEMLTKHEGPGRNPLATIGALVGYIPTVPQFDPIAKGMCVDVPQSVRDAGVRAVADSPTRCSAMRQAYESVQEQAHDGLGGCVSSETLLESFGPICSKMDRQLPTRVVLETCTGRLIGGQWGRWRRGSDEPIEREPISFDRAHQVFKEIAQSRPDSTLVFDGVGDPLMHAKAIEMIELAKECGIACVELRTDLTRDGIDVDRLMDSGLDMLSVDVLAESSQAYAAMCETDRLDFVYSQVQRIYDRLRSDETMSMWFVPRLTRCDAVFEEIEAFFDKWIMLCGIAVIDPLPMDVDDQLVSALPIPEHRRAQLDAQSLRVACDGSVLDSAGRAVAGVDVFSTGVEQAHRQVCSRERAGVLDGPRTTRSACANESAA
ncbi:MAG: 6-hydroxymethylpterin diphosphokinase MptE-like protein [Phycisphaerales bacterium]